MNKHLLQSVLGPSPDLHYNSTVPPNLESGPIFRIAVVSPMAFHVPLVQRTISVKAHYCLRVQYHGPVTHFICLGDASPTRSGTHSLLHLV